MTRVPLGLHAEVTTAGGTRYRWDANAKPADRPRNLSFRTKIGEGFSDASCQLARRIDQDYPDLNLVDTVAFVGADGTVAYEGRVSALPRELQDAHAINVMMAGWIAHAKDRKFTDILVDRDLGQWGEVSRQRRINNMTANYYNSNPILQVSPNTETGQAALVIGWTGAWTAAFKPIVDVVYDAGPGNTVGQLSYSFEQKGAASGWTDAGFQLILNTGPGEDDTFPLGVSSSGNLATSSAAFTTFTPTTVPGRFYTINWYYTVGPAGADNASFEVHWPYLAVYGAGVPAYLSDAPGQPAGVVASDMIRYLAGKYCPRLSTAGVHDTTYVIQHCTYREPTDPYDAFLDLNKYHLWHLGVWEDRILHFRPYDYTDYQWEIRTDDPGTQFSPQGPSTEDLFNGIVVSYTDILTGRSGRVSPTDSTALRDTGINNPWNQQGLDRWDEIQLSQPTLRAQAIQVGAMALAERNRPKAPGTIQVQGYIRDRGGNPQPVWKVRAGDMITLSNFPNDTPRLITETSYDDSNKSLSISVDRPAQVLDAYLDRLSTALTARGL
jgi:hypothetical protein